MQVSVQNSDSRPLPDGWVEHFDSQRKLWYYVDLDSDPPRVALIHPLDKNQPSSAPAKFREHGTRTPPIQRPIGPRENASSPSGSVIRPSQRPRRATVAQQLYASSLPINPNKDTRIPPILESGSSSRTSSRRPSGSNSPVSDDLASSSSSAAVSPSANENGVGSSVSSTSPTSPTHLDIHSPRNFFDCTRLSGTRRVTYSGPQPRVTRAVLAPTNSNTNAPKRDAKTSNAQSFYHHSVNTTPSPIPPPSSVAAAPNDDVRPSALSTIAVKAKKAEITSHEVPTTTSSSRSAVSHSGLNPKAMPPTSSSPDRKTHTAVVVDDAALVSDDSSSSSRPQLPPLDIPTVHDGTASIRPLPPISSRGAPRNIVSSLSNPDIVQPKPIRPMAGVTLNLQVQVAGLAPETSEPSSEPTSKRKKNPLLKNFGRGLSKNAKGKRPIRTVQDAETMEVSPISDSFGTRMEPSFRLIES